MCILFTYSNADPLPGGYKLILASNRDEYYARPASPAAEWEEDPCIVGGRDMEPGRELGTWLAIGNHNGRVKLGAILNITGEPHVPHALGRGFLINDYLKSDLTSSEFANKLLQSKYVYSSFVLLTVEISKSKATTLHCSNAPPIIETWPAIEGLGFGNSPTKQPLKKVVAGRKLFREILKRNDAMTMSRPELVDELMDLMKQKTRYWPDAELLRRAPDWNEQLSSICADVRKSAYGTRTHSVILIDANDRMDYYEQTMATTDPNGEWLESHITQQYTLTD